MRAFAAPVTRCFGRSTNRPVLPPDKSPSGLCRLPRQEFALNLSAKRRLCNTVGKRFIDGTARCCAVSTARSRAATTTNLARSSLAFWSLRRIPGGAKSSALVNLFMNLPPGRLVASRSRPKFCLWMTAISWHASPTWENARVIGLIHPPHFLLEPNESVTN